MAAAGLFGGLESFDSSAAGGADDHTGAPGLTLGSMAPSFRSESDYDAAPQPVNHTYSVDDDHEYGSLLDEQESVVTPLGGIEMESEDDALLTHPQQPRAGGSGANSGRTSASVVGNTQMLPKHLRPSSAASSAAGYARTASPSTHNLASDTTNATSPTGSSYNNTRGSRSRVEESEVDESALRDLELSSERWGGRTGKKKEKVGQHMTLREQEKVIDEFKKENFDLKLKIHFYEERLERLAPDQIDLALRENIQLKVEFQTLRTELKRYKKLLLEGNRAIENLTSERDNALRNAGAGGGKRELEKELDRRRAASERERSDREALESRVRDQSRELKELRDAMKRRRVDEYDGEDARAEISRLRAELDAERDAREDALGEVDDLRAELRGKEDDLDELRDGHENRREDSLVGDGSSRRGKDKEARRELDRVQRRVEELEQLNTSQRSQITAQVTMLATRNDEKEALKDEVENLKQDIVHLENELDQLDRARARSERSIGSSDDKSRDQLEKENDEYRDRVSAHALELERLENNLAEKEKEIEELLEDLDQHKAEHEKEIKQVEDDWREEVDAARADLQEYKLAMEDKEAEVEELSEKMEALIKELGTKDSEMKADSEEMEALTEDLKQLGAQIFQLEEEVDAKDGKIDELEKELNAVDKEFEDKQALHDQVVDALKEKLAAAKARLSEITIQHESSTTESKFLREKVEQLVLRTAELEEKSKSDLETRRRLEDATEELISALHKEEEERDLDQQEWGRQRREEEDKWQRTLADKVKELDQAQADLSHSKTQLSLREKDLQRLQDALDKLDGDSRRSGRSPGASRSSLEVELESLKLDIARLEDELRQERRVAEAAQDALRERDAALAAATSDSKELAAKLAAQTQTRLALSDKFDATVKNLRDAQSELASARERLRSTEDQLNSDHRTLSRTENQYRDQLTERNTLLLTVYQYMDKMVGAGDKSPRKPGYIDPKPFNNFPVFHNSLISRLKSVNQIQLSFDRRTKEIESRFTDQFTLLKRQQESRLRQIDRFEASIKSAADTQRQWRQRVNAKQVELDAAKATVTDLQNQMGSLRQRASVAGIEPGTAAKLSVLTTRASTAERRLAATQAQLASAEEKLGDARKKVGIAEGKWEARLQELQKRLHAAEEKVKRERQGAKERIAELSSEIKGLEGQVGGAKRRDKMLDDLMAETQKAAQSPRLL